MLGRGQVGGGQNDDGDAELFFQRSDRCALVVEDIQRNIVMHGDPQLIHLAFRGFVLDGAQQLQSRCFD